MYRYLSVIILLAMFLLTQAEVVIKVPSVNGDATQALRDVIEEAASFNGESILIELPSDTLHLSRTNASLHLYHISNTTSIKENPDATKYIGIWLKNLENVTVEGNGCLILTHGEMTSFVLDNCKNIKLQNFRIDSADPSVIEIDITDKGNNYIDFYILPPTNFELVGDSFSFVGEGWKFGDNQRNSNHVEYAQIYYPEGEWTKRCVSPMKNYKTASLVEDRIVRMEYEVDKMPDVKPGERYQLRHGIRNEACLFINRSSDITLSDIDFNFMGNFGVVSQFSENLTIKDIKCQPSGDSGRTNAGFADFLQFSSCRGLLKIENSRFQGSHDDPINIHGTHLQVEELLSSNEIIIEYKHPQTYGFLPCVVGDELILVNRKTLNDIGIPLKVKNVKALDDYRYIVTLENNLPEEIKPESAQKYVVENLSWNPEVIIKGNIFKLTPTRAILITTRGKSLIENNEFHHIPMASILLADDARSWYESGPVKNLTIRDNVFYDCKSPVVLIFPETEIFEAPVHENITIIGNQFINPGGVPVIKAKDSSNIKIQDNIFEFRSKPFEDMDKIINFENILQSTVQGNKSILSY